MAGREFTLIEKFFGGRQSHGAGVALGIGDDCALLRIEVGEELAVSTDTLVGGIHFPMDGSAELIGQRGLRVNLSDLAAMGAQPRWFLLALTLPGADEVWIGDFSRGLFAAASTYGVALVGGDTTRGPLSITITVMGVLPVGQALRRDGARPGDRVYVTGTLGGGAAGLAALADPALSAEIGGLRQKYWQPSPRLAEGQSLRGIASAAIDVSDGLLADLGHIARRSGVGAEIHAERLPLSRQIRHLGAPQQMEWALGGGDDYELCFTVPTAHVRGVEALIDAGQLDATAIGEIVTGDQVLCFDAAGHELALNHRGYDHFAS